MFSVFRIVCDGGQDLGASDSLSVKNSNLPSIIIQTHSVILHQQIKQ
jgi:hypothetical protein